LRFLQESINRIRHPHFSPYTRNHHNSLKPSINQFKYWGRKKKNERAAFFEGRSNSEIELRHKPSLNSTKNWNGPADQFQLDGTGGVIELVHEEDESLAVGKAHIYVMVDNYSGLITGWSVELSKASREQLYLVLLSSFTDKANQISERAQNYLHSAGIDPELAWPEAVVCRGMITDSGSELVGHYSDSIAELGLFEWDTAPPRTPTWKAQIERFFRDLKLSLRKFPGAAPTIKERQTKDPKNWAVLTLSELKDYLVLFFAQYNLTHTVSSHPDTLLLAKDGYLRGCPIDYWHWGIENMSGIGRWYPESRLRELLLPTRYVTVTNSGINLNRLKYSSDSLRNSFAHFRNYAFKTKSKQIKVAFDPRNASSVWLVRGDGTLGERCFLVGDFAQYEGQDLKVVHAALDAAHKFRNMSVQHSLNTRNALRDCRDDLEKRAQEAAKSITQMPRYSSGARQSAELQNREEQRYIPPHTERAVNPSAVDEVFDKQKGLNAHYRLEVDDDL